MLSLDAEGQQGDPMLDTARHDVGHAAEPRLGQSSGATGLFPCTIDFIHPLVDRRGPISTLVRTMQPQ